MDSISTSTAQTGQVHFLNVEYFFRLLYDTVFSGHANFNSMGLISLLQEIWNIVGVLAFLISIVALGFLIYTCVRLYQVRKEEHHRYTTLELEEAERETEHSRWVHIMALIESATESDWRQALIECDIMLDDLLGMRGYSGATVGDKLKSINPASLVSLNDAWEAHKVRNEIVHQGLAYPLDEHLAYRTVKQYENVFQELEAI